MNKMNKKFIWGVVGILLFTLVVSLWMNLFLVERYYLYQKKKDIDRICTELKSGLDGERSPDQVMKTLEESEEVVIVKLEPDSDVDRLNETLRDALQGKGIGLQKFWLWDQDYMAALENGRKLRLYNQGKLNYSLMVEYMQLDQGFFAVAMIIPHVTDAIRIINTCMAFIVAGALVLACGLMMLMVKRITRPLNQMIAFADRISHQEFCPMEIHTGDELEVVADSMNQMCGKLKEYQTELIDKNSKMEQLLDDVAHELKTPVALVAVYAQGIKDGMDDGTFLDTIVQKNMQMGELVEKLLTLSRIEQKAPELTEISLGEMLEQVLREQDVLAREASIVITADIVRGDSIYGSREAVMMIFSNIVSNAVKYSSGAEIEVCLKPEEKGYLFTVKNETTEPVDVTRIWDSFYVGEESRNKNLSGTGLGLAIVKKYGERMGYRLDCSLNDKFITFSVMF